MFRSISIARETQRAPGQLIDPGVLAEALIFYGTVTVFGHHASLRDLAHSLGPETLTELVQDGALKIVYAPVSHVVITQNAGSRSEQHSLGNVESADSDIEGLLPKIFDEQLGKSGRARRLARRVIQRVQTHRPKPAILDSARADVRDIALTRSVASDVLTHFVPEYSVPDDLRFDVFESGGVLQIETNIDFIAANALYHQSVPVDHSSLTPAYILGMVASTHEAISFASHAESELMASPLDAALIEHRVESTLLKSTQAVEQRRAFQEFVFRDAKAIGEAVRDGRAKFEDVLAVIRQSRKWKEWLVAQPEDVNLVHEYYDAVVRASWLRNLPAKSIRWSVFVGLGIAADVMGAGLLGTASGVALSALDATVVEKLVRGWRPNQFVEGPLRRMVERSRRVG